MNLALDSSAEISRLHATLLSHEFTQYVAMLKMVSEEPRIKEGDVDHILEDVKRLVTLGNGDFINAVYLDSDFTLYDAKGNVGKAKYSKILKAKDWEGKEFNITSPLKSIFENELIIMVAVPIRDYSGMWKGSLAVALDVHRLIERVSSIKLKNGSYAWLANGNGDVILHPNPKVIMKANIAKAAQSGFLGFEETLEKVKTQDHGYGRFRDTNINENKVITFSKVDEIPGWVLFVTTIESEIFSDIYAIVYNVFLVSNILMLVFMYLLSKFAKKITEPIARLTYEVRVSAVSNNQSITVIDSNDEIGLLSRAFSQSLRKIRQHTSQLESLVSERTKEIEAKNLTLATQNKKLEELASKDPLTQLYNRRAFYVFLEKEIARVNRHGGNVCLVMIDLDHFKLINDNHGHDVGDEVLCSIADCISMNSRKENVICRWGGEEFVVLIPEANLEAGMMYLEGLLKKVNTLKVREKYKVTFSAGISEFILREQPEQWIKRIDEALYQAKEAGRNRIVSA
ncbi:sensor domain-containing diguanylate cyclase [Vibrio sp. RC27]